jgi:hypothetical protein
MAGRVGTGIVGSTPWSVCGIDTAAVNSGSPGWTAPRCVFTTRFDETVFGKTMFDEATLGEIEIMFGETMPVAGCSVAERTSGMFSATKLVCVDDMPSSGLSF